MSLRCCWRNSGAFRPLSVLFVALTACTVPACGSDGTEDPAPVVEDTGSADVMSDATDTTVPDTEADAADTSVDSGSDATDDVADSAAEVSEAGDDAADSATDAPEDVADTSDASADIADTAVELDTGVDSGVDTGVDMGVDTGPPVPINVLALGEGHTCGVKSDGSVYCWGENTKGQLADGSTYGAGLRTQPTLPVIDKLSGMPLTGAVEVISGDQFSCARLASGSVNCWGYYFNGALGDSRTASSGDAAEPAAVVNLVTNATQLAGTGNATFACALLADTTVKCWGYNGGGQIGNGTKTSITSSVAPLKVGTPVDVYVDGATSGTKLTGVTQLSANYWTVCARLSDATARCWGYNQYANVGMGKAGVAITEGGEGPEFKERLRPTSPTALVDVAEIRVGQYHTCARHGDGAVSCWGRNQYGEIGDAGPTGANTVRKNPVKLSAVTDVQQLALGSGFTCVRLASGEVSCWGRNNIGQLGNGTTRDSLVPTKVSGITNAVEIWATSTAACARLASGDLKCWGNDVSGELGRGTVFNWTTPTRNPGLAGVAQVAIGRSASPAHGCAALTDKSMRCWGSGAFGQLGDPSLNNTFSPIVVSGMTAVEEIGLGNKITCARLTGGAVSCFGDNLYGALGGGTVPTASTPTATPVAVGGVTTAKQLAVGPAFACALLADSTVKCWGNNDDGQLGDNTTTDTGTAKLVEPLPPASFIAAGGASAAEGHACAISSLDGSLYCWGGNANGQIGDGTTTDVKSPKKVGIGSAATKVALGGDHTCVLLADKTVACFGYNVAGQLGDGTFADKRVPTLVPGLSNVTDLWAGDNFTCARLASGAIRCWGENANGQLADGSLSSRATAGPGLIGLAGSSVADLGLGRTAGCAKLTDGTARCWGAIQFGALGDGTGTYTTTPVTVTY